MVEEQKYKIALITAYVGTGEDAELSFAHDAKAELAAYGVDIYMFNNESVDVLKSYIEPTLSKNDIIHETKFEKSIFRWYLRFKYKQNLKPKEQDNYTRLIAKIPKILFYNLIPNDYDYYIWLDSKFTIHKHWLDYVLWLIRKYPAVDIITSKHSERNSIAIELDLMNEQMKKFKTKSFLSKYNLLEINNQVKRYLKSPKFVDDKLYELGMIIYSSKMLGKTDFLEEWYAHNYYLSIQDQLSFPYLCKKYIIAVQGVKQDIINMPFARHEYGL